MSQVTLSRVQASFVEAIRAHQAGRLADAERFLLQALEFDPRHSDSLHLLGVIALQTGRFDRAAELIGKAVALNGMAPPYHANLGTALRHSGRLAEAARSYRKALQLNANYVEAHNNLGTTLRDLGQLQEAEACFLRALHLKSDYADAHNNLGNLLRETGRLEQAEASYRKALQLTPPGHPKAAQYYGNYATALRDLGRLEEADANYSRALRLRPDDAELHSNLGVVLRDRGFLTDADRSHQVELLLAPERAEAYNYRGTTLRALGRLSSAEELCHRALQLDPDYADAHNSLGTVLYDLGQLAAAQDHLDKALNVAPDNALYHFNLAATKRYTSGDPQIAAMESLLPRIGSLPAEQQIHLQFALGKAYDDIGERDRAFGHLLAGNGLKRRQITYDEAELAAHFAHIKQVFTVELMRQKQAPSASPDGPIFILGMPRSGSTLIEQILASHPQVFGAGELGLFKQAINKAVGPDSYPDKIPGLSRGDLIGLGQTYLSALRAEAPDAPRVTDKLLRNYLYCGLIHLAVPNARIIHTRRDPVDTCLSIFSKLFVGEHSYGYDLAELGRYYRAYHAMMEHWRSVLPEDVMITVDYEQVVGDLEGQARRILAHCGLPWDDACLSFHQTERAVRTASATQVRQPIYTSSVGRWRPSAELLKPLTDELSQIS